MFTETSVEKEDEEILIKAYPRIHIHDIVIEFFELPSILSDSCVVLKLDSEQLAIEIIEGT